MRRRIFGLESEYGLTCMDKGNVVLGADALARHLFEDIAAFAMVPNLFLQNGARLYVDTGFHPEYATPECDDLRDLVAADRAGERIIEGLVRDAQRRLPERGVTGQIQAFKNNTDYAGNSYGCHENYLVSRETDYVSMVDALVPFLVSRQVFAGAGKIERGPRGVEYHLSQRAQHIAEEVSGATVSGRPIINTRDEPHADASRFRRLHVIVGDSNMSEVATFLKVGATTLVLDMIEDGFLREDLRLQSSVTALRAISSDPTLTCRVPLRNGRAYTALELQLSYLDASEEYVRRAGGDALAAAVLARWRDVLARLAKDPMTAAADVDWVTKRALIERYRERHGCALDDPRVALLDLRYHDVATERGLHRLLARQGQVATVVAEQDIDRAIARPPQTTRARLRGEFIRRARLRGSEYQVDWAFVRTIVEGQSETVFCPDPFVAHDERVERLVA
jgi:proteasome accessory factor A